MKPLYKVLALAVQQRNTCIQTNNQDWLYKTTKRIEKLVKNHMPSGNGIDSGTKIDLDKSDSHKLFFAAPFHHMDENGYYDGWTDHTIVVSPSLTSNFELRITGRDRNDVKEYLYQTFEMALSEDVEEYPK